MKNSMGGTTNSSRIGSLPVRIFESLLLSFIIVNAFIIGGGHQSLLTTSLSTTTTTNHGFFANAFSVPSTSVTMSLLGLRRRQERHHHHHEQPLFPQPRTLRARSSSSLRSAVYFPPILISFTCLVAFQKQPALAMSLSKIINSSSTSILGAAATTTFKTLSNASTSCSSSSYHLTRILFLRLLAIVYITAFSIAKFQNVGLIGDHGILPARNILNESDLRAMEKSKRRNEWLIERKQYTSTFTNKRINSNFLVRWKNFFIGGPINNFMHEKFWHRTDKMDRPLLSLLWLAPNRNKLNPWLTNLANIGILLSLIMLCTGSANVFLLLGLWSIQRSFMAVGGDFYGYGWEMQLAELTFLAMFLVPIISMNPFFGPTAGGGPDGVGSSSSIAYFPVPILVIWAIRWFLFKIMLGAGLIKLKSSDVKWKLGNMSAMDYFYETQPVPNPFSRYFHFNPKKWHRFEVCSNHFVELVAPFLLLMPFRKLRQIGGIIQIMFQMILISSGNLSFLNWLTIVPALCSFDDASLMNLPPIAQKIIFVGTHARQSYIPEKLISVQTPTIRNFVSIAFFVLVVKLNINVVRNLLARRQIMNGSFDRFRLCGTYGAFGVVSEQREELIIESASEVKGPWLEYQFKVKPGDVNRRPKWISPYHHRLDWQMWIACQSGPAERSQWLLNLLLKLLKQEKDVIDLIECDPWKLVPCNSPPDRENESPKYIRIEKYLYKFYNHQNDVAVKNVKSPYWVRHRMGRFFPKQGIVTVEMLDELVKRQ